MPTYYQEPEEMGEPSTPRRADTQVFPASSTESSDDEYMTASMPNIPIGSYPSGLVGPVGPAAGQPLGGPAVNAAVAGVASMSYAPPAQSPLEAREPVPGVLTRRNGFYARTSQDQSALYEVPNPGALTRVATELSALTSDGGPVRRGSVELDLSPSRRLTPQEREISAQNAGFYNYDQLKSVLEKAWEYVPPKVETGGNFISVIGALVENKPTEIAGAALTTATAFAGLINATRERDYERAALHLGNLGVGGSTPTTCTPSSSRWLRCRDSPPSGSTAGRGTSTGGSRPVRKPCGVTWSVEVPAPSNPPGPSHNPTPRRARSSTVCTGRTPGRRGGAVAPSPAPAGPAAAVRSDGGSRPRSSAQPVMVAGRRRGAAAGNAFECIRPAR
ncbi:hypothetical protein [Micromonospora yangpuensis]|uniref:Uncharacterized protein n=1 Tax=Micromonospora yangpuensis TaxID=683228 RepID=A0A1C6TYP8_9ACTN|nr:hypothetical protein [Micromonospora yangpuensis]SCL46925.1 hypothetical protein GA0070617_0430 [Micromonospora yangpuensis]